MVNLLNHTVALLKLIRWPNLLIVAATQVLLRLCILLPLCQTAGISLQLPWSRFILLVIATVLITAGGYAINDYFDRKIDRVNRPQSLIVGTLIYPRHAMAYHLIFTISGVLLGSFLAFTIRELYLGLVFFMVSGLLWFYSTTYKRELLLGNVVVALLTALVPFLVVLFELPLLAREFGSEAAVISKVLITWTLGFSVFAFLLNLIREVVKDMEDFEGDHAYGKKTIPVVWGLRAAQWIAVVLTVMVMMLLSIAWFTFVRDEITLIYFIVMLIIPLAFVVAFVLKENDLRMIHRASLLLKLIMLSGLGYMIAVCFIIRFWQ